MSTFNTISFVMFTVTMIMNVLSATIGGDDSQTHYILVALGAGILALSYLFL